MSQKQILLYLNAKRTTACNDINKLDLGNEAIHRVTCTTFLGIYLDEDLEWSAHIDHVDKKYQVVVMQYEVRNICCLLKI